SSFGLRKRQYSLGKRQRGSSRDDFPQTPALLAAERPARGNAHPVARAAFILLVMHIKLLAVVDVALIESVRDTARHLDDNSLVARAAHHPAHLHAPPPNCNRLIRHERSP